MQAMRRHQPPCDMPDARPRLAVILVHYRAAALAREAIDAVCADARRSNLELEGIVVDNGNDAAGHALLADLPFARLDPGVNLGFAGGVNFGVASSSAPTLVVMNPDVEVLPGCLSALVASVEGRCAVAGPRFFWDRGRRFLLPPTELRSRLDELLALLAERNHLAARRARARWRRHAHRHWSARERMASHALSGGLLAFSRAAWQRVGPFDAGYRLYFEETDWLRRAARCDVQAFYVPEAEAIHSHGRSAAQEPLAAAWFAESAERYRRLSYGAGFSKLLTGLARAWPASRAPAANGPANTLNGPSGYHRPVWIEVSPNPAGYPAAAEFLMPSSEEWVFPSEIEQRLAGELLTARAVDPSGRELGEVDLERWRSGRDVRERAAV